MNRVVGGSMPAEIWRDIMTGAHAAGAAAAVRAAPATADYAPQEPGYPQDRIADDFIARALGDDTAATGSIDQLMQR